MSAYSSSSNSNDQTSTTRKWSDLDILCDKFMHDFAQLDPISATDWGMPGDPGTLPDLSPAGIETRIDLERGLLEDLEKTPLRDSTDHVTASALRDRLNLDIELFDAGEFYGEINNIASPIQGVRDAFSLMPTDTSEDWGHITDRLNAIPAALAGYKESLELAAERGIVAARRQVQIGIDQSKKLGDPRGYFAALVKGCPDDVKTEVSEDRLTQAVQSAASAYAELAEWLGERLMPNAPAIDGVGRERYEMYSALFVGARVDLDETYEWGITELERIKAAQARIAHDLYGTGVTVAEAVSRLEADPNYQIHGKERLLEWLQTTADMAVRELNGTQFEIPGPLQTIECMIAPSDEGGIWYTAPSLDFSRPGRMWWSIPAGDMVFHAWQERTTVFHEGVPGHHLQLSQAIYQADTLNLWRRLGSWNSGYGEGWALYAEQLMADLGYQDDPADRLGMLDAQRLRATRVVLDIGVHLGKERPDGNGMWDADYAWDFLRSNVTGSDSMLRFELDRYLGWPGQAPSYKIGQRLWEQLRDDFLATDSDSRDRDEVLRDFHTRALNLGSLPMTTLRQALLG